MDPLSDVFHLLKVVGLHKLVPGFCRILFLAPWALLVGATTRADPVPPACHQRERQDRAGLTQRDLTPTVLVVARRVLSSESQKPFS